MRIRRVLAVLMLSMLPVSAFAVPSLGSLVNPLKALSAAFPGGAAAWEALAQFRGPFNPVNAVIGVGIGIGLYELCDNVNCYDFVPGQDIPWPSIFGWSSPDVPPSTVPLAMQWAIASDAPPLYASPDAACAAVPVCFPNPEGCSGFTNPGVAVATSNPGKFYCQRIHQPDGVVWTDAGPVYGSSSCAAGYKLVNSNCVLDEPASGTAKWPSDGKPTFRPPFPGAWEPHVRDPDVGTTPANGELTRTGTDARGNPVRETIKATADGGTDLVRDTESVDAQGRPTVQRDRVHTDARGVVTSSTSTTYGNTTLSNVTNVTGTGTQIDVSGLNQEATQQRVAGAVEGVRSSVDAMQSDTAATRTALDSIDQKLKKDTSVLPAVPHIDDFTASWNLFADKLMAGPVGSMFTVSAAEPSGGCVTYPIPLAYFDTTLVIDQHCTIWPAVSPTIASFMPYVWSLLAVFILFSA